MATVADYLIKLDELRDALARNLAILGVPAQETEALQTLIPKILKIPVGDISQEYQQATFLVESFPCTFGFLSYREYASFVGITAISGLNRIKSARMELRGQGVELLDITAEGWANTKAQGIVTLTKELPVGTSRFDLQGWIDQITLRAQADVIGVATLSVIGADTGTQYQANGALKFRFARNSWSSLEAIYPTWAALEAEKLTWEDVENKGKP